jgi:hypothetical protein
LSEEQTFDFASCGFTGEKAGGQDFRIVEHKAIAGRQKISNAAESAVDGIARRAVKNQQS